MKLDKTTVAKMQSWGTRMVEADAALSQYFAASTPVDTEPLRSAAKAFKDTVDKIADWKLRISKLEEDVEEYMATAHPDDEKGMQIASLKKGQIEVLPSIIAREEKKLPALADALLLQAKAMERRLALCLEEDRAACLAIFNERFPNEDRNLSFSYIRIAGSYFVPYLPGTPETIFWEGSAPYVTAGTRKIPTYERSVNPENFDRELIRRTEELVSIAESYRSQDRAE